MNARKVFVGLWLTITLICWTAATPLFADSTIVAVAVDSIGMTVSDMDRSVAFYSDVLAFKFISDVEVDGPEYDQLWGIFGVRARVVRMQLGAQQLELIEFLAPPDMRPIPVPSYSNDLWFQHVAIVVRDMEAAWAQLRKHHVRQVSPRPQTIPISNPSAAGIKAIRFRDPDGHNLELLWFPEGKGNPRWHKLGSEIFLGIDHTAITVRSTESSIKFYRDLLGMTVAGGTLNMGTQQEHLDSLPGARARVTGIRPMAGTPGVEFLEYELPIAGRPMPGDSHPTDLWHWQTTLVVPDVEATAATLRSMRTHSLLIFILLIAGASTGWAVDRLAHSQWSYDGQEGTAHWGMLSPAFMVCEAGSHQSPINITMPRHATMRERLSFHYQSASVHTLDNGPTIQVTVPQGSELHLNGRAYRLEQFHFHEPREHHVWMAGLTRWRSIWSTGMSKGMSSSACSWRPGFRTSHSPNSGPCSPRRGANRVQNIRSTHELSYRLIPTTFLTTVSLTTPPCNEGVQWIVLRDPINMLAQQVEQFVSVIGHNARPIQPLHGRQIREE